MYAPRLTHRPWHLQTEIDVKSTFKTIISSISSILIVKSAFKWPPYLGNRPTSAE